jgi:very-short-patch-repair endonuclease
MHRDLVTSAERQHGLLTRPQIGRLLTRHQFAGALRAGRLAIVRPGVVRVAGTPPTWEQAVLGACLAAGTGTVASFRTAARLWTFAGLDGFDGLEITTPSRRRSRIAGVTVHDTMVLGPAHVSRRNQIPTTSPARTLCDLTACCPPWDVERALDDALRRKLTTLHRLERVFLDLAQRGRRRSTVMRALLEARLPGFDPGDSDMETKLVRWIVGAGLPRPVQQHRVRISGRAYRLDLAYPDLLVGIEYDGWDPHRTRVAFDGDRARQNPLEIIGWLILRYTSKSTRQVVVREVGDALAARTPSK